MAQNYFDKALADEGLLGTSLESFARSIHQQESGSGKNTSVSSAGARGPMQLMPNTFNELMPGGDINDAYQNTVAGLRYIKKMNALAGGDLTLTAAGYYGGPGALEKAKRGEAVGVPTDKNAPNTLEYAKQVLSRTDKNVSRETPAAIRENIADLGQNYQAAYALMANLDETPETEREAAAREEKEDTESAAQFASIQKQLTSAPVKSPFQVAQKFAMGGMVNPADFPVSPLEHGGAVDQVNFAQHFEKGGDAKAASPNYGGPEKWIAEKIGLGPAYEASVNAPGEMGLANEAGTQGDAVRHMTLMREIEKKYGALPARALGWGHEYIIGSLSEQPSRDREMDLHNNALGLELSKQAGGDDAKFRELMRQALENKQADYYRQEYVKPKRRAEGSPEEGERSLKDTAKTMYESFTNPEHWKELGAGAKRAATATPGVLESLGRGAIATVPGTPGDIESLVRLATGGKQVMPTTEDILKKTENLRVFQKPEGAEDLEMVGGWISPAGAPASAMIVKGAGKALKPSTAKAMLQDVKGPARMAADEIDPAVAKEIMEAKTGPAMPQRTSILPTADRPFVGQLERIAADMNPSTVEQFRNMVAKSGRDYEVERLNRALEGLGPKDKINSKMMLERLEKTLPPSRYRNEIVEPGKGPEFVDFHQTQDNPYPSQKMGVIRLSLDRVPEEALETKYAEQVKQNLTNIKLSNTNAKFDELQRFLEGPQVKTYFNDTPVSEMFKADLPALQKLRDEKIAAEKLYEAYEFPLLGRQKQVYDQASALIKQDPTKYPNYSFALQDAEAIVKNNILKEIDQKYGLSVEKTINSDAIQSLSADNKKDAIEKLLSQELGARALEANRNLQDILKPYENVVNEVVVSKLPYEGKHRSVIRDNPISFSRYVDVKTPDGRKGMVITELQSDRFKDVKQGRAPEAFATMADSPQVTQQLMIKNAIFSGVKRNTDVVLFPGADSAQAQLYEKLPYNLKTVVKDLGPGFKMEKIKIPNEKGDIIERYGVTWDKKAAERLQREGVRFAQGGFVEKNY